MSYLTAEDEYHIRQVEATMTIEDMPLTPQARQNLIGMATGKKTRKQVIAEILERYFIRKITLCPYGTKETV